MPTYQYRCTECGRDLEVVQRFSDAALTSCPSCKGKLRKVFSAVGVVFKGSGFYSTDNHTHGATAAAAPAHEHEHETSGSAPATAKVAAGKATGSDATSSAPASSTAPAAAN
ncbi:FmdB family zinc ribbon protein [Acidipropionibacterium thoenii]|uniref:FmdB family zinc ribbon protein n=1 Tax=Acidipropionibacterium thoenii TaxID=1751 RepID=UPI000414829A|nr:FmdB family zinc ribbon protein [Acidipropionibacterium thoenii]